MRFLHIISIAILLTSCHRVSEEMSEMADLSGRIRPGFVSETSLNHIDIQMNKEVTDMTFPIVNEGAAEAYLKYDDKNNQMMYNILTAFASRQIGDYSKAYDHILSAEHLAAGSYNDYYFGMIWLGRYLMSQYMQDYTTAVTQALRASKHFKNLDDPCIDYKNYLLEAVRSYIIIGQYEVAESFLSNMEALLPEMHHHLKPKYYDALLCLYRHTDRSRLPEILTQMREKLPESDIYWLNVAYTYYLIGQDAAAIDAIEKYRIHNSRFGESVAYHGICSLVLDDIEEHESAMDHLKKYIHGTEEEYQKLIDSDIFLKEQKMNAEIAKMKHRNALIIYALSICLLLSIGVTVFIILRRRIEAKTEEAAKYAIIANKAAEELDRLKLMYENKTLNKELIQALEQRMSVFNKYILNKMLPNYSLEGAEKDLHTLISSKDTFLESTCRTFEVLHPEFSAFLASCNLTERERGCCCLYCMGMRGNEIAAYMGLADNSYYNFSSTIRKKLGIKEYKTNLDFFLRDKITELDN